MPDSKDITHGSDRKLVALNQDYEVRYWSEKFGVSKEELARAVDAVGSSADKVGEFLQKNRHH